MAGRPRKPAAKKIAAGNPGGRKIKPNIQSRTAAVEPPDWVAVIPAAREEWETLIDERVRLGIHTILTVNSFGRYCILMAAFRLVIPFLLADGPNTKKGAAMATLLDIEGKLKPLEVEMGGTPKSQNWLHMAPETNPATAALVAEFFPEN